MNKGIMAVYDIESDYAADFVNHFHDTHFRDYDMYAFTELNSLAEFAENTRVNVLLVSVDAYSKSLNDMNIERIIVLSDDEGIRQYDEYPCVYKYQRADNVLRETLQYVAKRQSDISKTESMKRVKNVIGVYSPVKRCMKTMFSITLSDIMADNNQVLYLNFEEYTGFQKIMRREFIGDLSDLMYFYIQKPESLAEKFNAICQNYGKIDFVPPMMFSENIRNIDVDEWKGFIRTLRENVSHNVIVLDLSDMIKDVQGVLEICDVVYMPVLKDFISKAKIEEFYRVLYDREREEIKEKIREVEMGEQNYMNVKGNDVMKIINGEFREFVKEVMI